MKWSCLLLGTVCGVLALGACGCRRTDVREQKIHLPGLKNPECAEVITKALQQYAGQPTMERSIQMDSLRYDYPSRSLRIRFDSMKVALKNIEHVIAAAGFEANDIPADTNAAAKLPMACR